MDPQLSTAIKAQADQLICQTHPQVCFLRDQNYPRLEQLVGQQLFADKDPISIQTALAEIERELSDSQ